MVSSPTIIAHNLIAASPWTRSDKVVLFERQLVNCCLRVELIAASTLIRLRSANPLVAVGIADKETMPHDAQGLKGLDQKSTQPASPAR
jgi:hypothetical protein